MRSDNETAVARENNFESLLLFLSVYLLIYAVSKP